MQNLHGSLDMQTTLCTLYIVCSILVAIGIEAFNRFNEEAKELNSSEENEENQRGSRNEETDPNGCWMHIKVLCIYDIIAGSYSV